MTNFIGIDLGTTFSAAAYIDQTGRPVIIRDEDGHNITPSCVAIEGDKMDVGEEARKAWGVDESLAAARFKRAMGEGKKFQIDGHEFSPTELSAAVLKKIFDYSKFEIGEVHEAVITIPANFSTEAREATMEAARRAGIKVRYIVNEPTAAALYHAFKQGNSFEGVYAVYDLGGGTFDVSIIKVDGHDVTVLGTAGVSRLGGDDFDKAIYRLVAGKYKRSTGENLSPRDFSLNDAEERKKSLSKKDTVRVGVNREVIEIARAEFEEAISSLIAQTEMLCEEAVEEAGVDVSEIKAVLLAGGSTRIPLVQKSITRVFGQDPVSIGNVDEVVALGAALYAAYKGDQSVLTEIQRQSIGGINVAERTSKYFGTITLGYDEERGQESLENSILIKKGNAIPCSVTESFYTISEGQTNVRCKLTESSIPESDPQFVKVIWEGDLDLPPNRPEGQEIKVTYLYDDNQILQCVYEDVSSGKKTDVNISLANKEDELSIEKFMVD